MNRQTDGGSRRGNDRVFPSAGDDARTAGQTPPTPQTRSPTFRLAYQDPDFLIRNELRPVRLQLELLKPELTLAEKEIEATVVVFGSSRIPESGAANRQLEEARARVEQSPDDPEAKRALGIATRIADRSRYYEEARRFAAMVSTTEIIPGRKRAVVVTGGGPGIMEAANRGAFESGMNSIGLNIVIPHEQQPNLYITPDLCFQFHYFAIRKMHFLLRARAMVAFPGGFGTMDELFETLTLVQTGKIRRIPIVLYCREYWEHVIDFDAMVDEGVISASDLDLFEYADTAEDGIEIIRRWYADGSADAGGGQALRHGGEGL